MSCGVDFCLGLGIDLLEKKRLAGWLCRPGIRRRFSAAEIAFAENSGRPEEAMAAAFAAKEAFYKAAGALLSPEYADELPAMFWQAHLRRLQDGRPEIDLQEPWAGRLRAAGVQRILISISHDREQVLAAVILLAATEHTAEGLKILHSMLPAGFLPLMEQAEQFQSGMQRLDLAWAAQCLPLRPAASHKGNFGRVLVVGGSNQYVGAVQLAAEAALRAGAGLVTLAAPWLITPLSPEIMRLPLAAPAGYLAADGLPALQNFLTSNNPVLALGMGLGRAAETCVLVRSLMQTEQPKVIDADGLFAMAEQPLLPLNAVLTPHNGEMARLLGDNWTAADVENDRLAAVQLCADKYQAVTVLKGQHTLICTPAVSVDNKINRRQIFVNTSGNPGMATGGSGDVLAGMIASWLAQGLPAWQAASFGVYLHGLAGDLAAAAKSQYAMTALDILNFLPQAYLRILEEKEA